MSVPLPVFAVVVLAGLVAILAAALALFLHAARQQRADAEAVEARLGAVQARTARASDAIRAAVEEALAPDADEAPPSERRPRRRTRRASPSAPTARP